MASDVTHTRPSYRAALIASSLWSALLALKMLFVQGSQIWHSDHAHPESLFLLAVALFHGIYAVWFWQGRDSLVFANATAFGRALLGIVSIGMAIQLQHTGAPDNLPTAIALFWIDYLWISGLVEITSAIAICRATLQASPEQPPKPTPFKNSETNRFLFACYMSGLAICLGAATTDFLGFFHFPTTLFLGWQQQSWGPVHLLVVQIAVLAWYNFVAAKHHIQPLIEAGVRGGLFTCVFFVLLVLGGLLHPLTLLLPMVDFISVVLIFTRRLTTQT